jgi:Spy/CpxP family protein refolding chaperone
MVSNYIRVEECTVNDCGATSFAARASHPRYERAFRLSTTHMPARGVACENKFNRGDPRMLISKDLSAVACAYGDGGKGIRKEPIVKLGKWTLAAAAMLMSTTYLIADEPTTPTTVPTAASLKLGKKSKLDKPWSELKTLTPEQTDKIEKIHADALEQEKKIKEKEMDDIAALLTPAQVEEYKAVEAKDKVEQKEKSAEKAKMKAMGTTMPTTK